MEFLAAVKLPPDIVMRSIVMVLGIKERNRFMRMLVKDDSMENDVRLGSSFLQPRLLILKTKWIVRRISVVCGSMICLKCRHSAGLRFRIGYYVQHESRETSTFGAKDKAYVD